ncbi:MAG: DUF1476 domain-containing protein [Alphaproteobacteria bacterium]|nr:DUF1476 domain-containing protein [Alphaproteobacteria bacterium]
MEEDHKKSGKKVLEERKRAFEAKYQQDEEIKFKTRNRANRLVGLWVAEKIGLDESKAATYAKLMVETGFADPEGAGVVAKVLGDLAAHGQKMDEHALKREMERLNAIAREQIITEFLGENA